MERIGSLPPKVDQENSRDALYLYKHSPSKEVIEVERLKQKRDERRLQLRLASEQSVTKLSPLEKKAAFCIAAIKKFRAEVLSGPPLAPETDLAPLQIQPKIQVCVRKRPLLQKELDTTGCFDTISCKTGHFPYGLVHLHEPRLKLDLSNDILTHSFSYDYVFDEETSNQDVYEAVIQPLISSFLSGGKASFFAFGQTNSGKTYTIFGSPSTEGLLSLLLQQVFDSGFESRFVLTSSFVEIYGGKVFDLNANRKTVKLLEDLDGVIQLHGQQEIQVDSRDSLLRIVEDAMYLRSVGSTDANTESSRSHAIFTLTLWSNDTIYGKFTLVDLAGSERGSDTGHSLDKKARMEGSGINKSLLALKECIRILHLKRTRPEITGLHIPFRDSKLTQILRESFVGKNSQTAMMCCVAPASTCVDQTLNTLRYGDRVKEFSPDLAEPKPSLNKKPSLPQIPHSQEIQDDSVSVKVPLDKGEVSGAEAVEEEEEEMQSKLVVLKVQTSPSEHRRNSVVDAEEEEEEELIMQQHLHSMIQSTILSKQERLCVAQACQPNSNLRDYLVDSINLIEKKIALWKDVKDKMDLLLAAKHPSSKT